MLSAFELLQGATVFTKLDLRKAYHHVLQDMLNRFIFVNIDDILIFSRSLENHVQHVRAVLLCLLEHSLFVKAEKCEFHFQVSFLRYVISPGNVQMDPAKVILNWPVPDALPTFTTALFEITASWQHPLWPSPVFTSAPILHIPDAALQFVVEVDVSDVGVGAVLSHRPSLIRSSTPAPFSPDDFHQPKETTISGTVSCLR